MAFALILMTGLALAGLGVVSAQGFVLGAHFAAAAPDAGALVGQHVRWAIPTMLVSLFSQSMVIFYFIGTGKLIEEQVASYPEKEKNVILGALRRFKSRISPPATLALLSAIGVFV